MFVDGRECRQRNLYRCIVYPEVRTPGAWVVAEQHDLRPEGQHLYALRFQRREWSATTRSSPPRSASRTSATKPTAKKSTTANGTCSTSPAPVPATTCSSLAS